ncbi:helix-turn-helix domain-containing protein [Knoellia sp. LjRoot47]|uniref:helix-turn-helix domain-containing protein n=1 Tax=Knoellia sp. LjRoot47 TaxID=3342330 RepID=UPI003ECD2665
MTTTDNLEQQRALYGAPLSELGATVREALGLTQGRLAEVLGLSAPMLSQLLSGQRVKIGNPAVVHRLQLLLDLSADASELSNEELGARLAAIREEQSTLTGSSTDDVALVRSLAASATTAQLRAVAAEADRLGARRLSDLLGRASEVAHG